MLIELELNTNDAESLLQHCTSYRPSSGDCAGDCRLSDAMGALAFAIRDAMNEKQLSGAMETIDTRLLEAAISLFGDRALAIDWLSKPMRAFGGQRSLDVDIEEVLELIGRLEHGFGA